MEKRIYAHDTLEFVTVAAQVCVSLEQCAGRKRDEFVAEMLRLLPLLYMKAALLPKVESNGDFLPDDKVTEADYDFIRNSVWEIMGDADEYETLAIAETGAEEMRWQSVSEGLADTYQALRNFVAVYQERIVDCMHDALWAVMDAFELYWGQAVLDTLRRLHQLRYTLNALDDEDALQ